jgi:hypothetical protein
MESSHLQLSELLDDGFTDVDGRLVCDEADAFLLDHVQLSPQLLERIMRCMLFALTFCFPSGNVVILPNPVSRFCLDLRSPKEWLRNKKIKKHIDDFAVVMKTSLRADLRIAKAYHESKNGSTWITDELIDSLQDISSSARDSVQCFSFSLVLKSSGQTAAACLGFACGAVYQDFTMCTPLRDHRSCGSMLSRIVCGILQQMGIQLWYWGYRMPYMEEYASYGAREFGRREFNDVLRSTMGAQLLPLSMVRLPSNITLCIQEPDVVPCTLQRPA